MKKDELKRLIDTAAGRIPADVVIKNCKIVNVFSGKIPESCHLPQRPARRLVQSHN